LEPNASSLNLEYNSKINAEISCEQESLITKDKQKISIKEVQQTKIVLSMTEVQHYYKPKCNIITSQSE